MKKNSVLRKVLAISLAAAMLAGTGFTTAGQFVGTSVSVSAAQVYGDFKYEVNEDNTITITKYTGNGGDVTIPNKIDGKSVTSIGSWAFYGCSSLTSVTIGNSVTSIGDNTFRGCTGLTSVTIGNSVTSIGSSVFDGCTGLTSVTIGNSVTYIDDYAFSDCTGLKSINVGKDNEKYSSKDGVLFDKDKKTLLLCPRGKTGKYTIPDSVTSIGDSAFRYCTGLTSIEIPDSVTSIGSSVFVGCTGLTSVTIGNSVTSIGSWAFSGCTGLTSVTIGNSVTYISDYAFDGCTGLTSVTIGNSVTEIGDSAFFGCTGLTSIVIPDSVTEIGIAAFYDCTGLTSVTIGNSVTEIGGGAFSGCTGLKSINVGKDNEKYSSKDGVLFDKDKKTLLLCPWGKTGKYTIPDSVTSIGGSAFYECTGLTSIVIPDSVTEINGFTFYDCKSLTSVVIPDSVTSIGGSAFSGCTGLTSVTIPDSVTEIGYYAFWGCTGLTSVTIGNSVTSIGGGAFSGCTGLTSVVIPDSVTEIGNNAFGYYTYYDVFENYRIGEINGFKIYGAKGSAAETYANENYILFVAVLMNTSTLSANEITLGQTVTVNAKASEDNCTYAVYYRKKSDTKWTTKQDFSTNDTVTIKPAKATDYEICVKAKDSTGKVVKKYFDVKVNVKLANTSTLSAENITLGQQITVNGLAQGGMGEYQYQVVYKQTSQSKWTTAQAFSENATVTFKPAKTTTYDVCVKVKDSNGTIVKKFFTVQVNAKLTNTSAVSATEIKKGSTVTVNGSATGGVGDYTYAVYYKQKAQTKWTVKQDFNENSDVSVKPAQATDYDICVKVKDKDGTIAKQYFTVTVTK